MSEHPTAHAPDAEQLAEAGLQYVVDGAMAIITLDRPAVRNAQTPRMWQALAAIGDAIGDEVRVVLLRGAGQDFSAGLDRALLDPSSAGQEGSLIGMLSGTDQEMADTIDPYQRGFTFLRDPRFVSIAVVQGNAIGAGFQLALSCDLRVVADDARFSMREAALGLVPDLTGTKPLVELVGPSRALEICATARNVGAEEASRLGLANVVVPEQDLDAAVAELVSALTAPMPGAVRAIKELIQGASSRSLEEQRRAEREAQVLRFRELAAMFASVPTD